jgi:hypothetical protein
MARNLSERLLDMVEDDARFTNLEPATIVVWLRLMRLWHRSSSRRPGEPGISYSYQETIRFLRVTHDEFLGHRDALVSRGLLVLVDDRIFAPPECRGLAPVRRARVEPRFVPQIVPIGRR